MQSSESKSGLKGCIETIGVIGGILTIITSVIVIYQFVSGNASIAVFFHSAPATTPIAQATSTPVLSATPSPSFDSTAGVSQPPTPTSAPGPTYTQPSTASHSDAPPSFIDIFVSSTPIPYNSFWPWLLWAVIGILFGGSGTCISNWIKYPKVGWEWEDFPAGIIPGGITGILLGFLSSFLINLIHIPYGFLINLGVDCILVTILYISIGASLP